MAGVDVFFAVLVDVAVSGQCGSWLMGVEEEEAVALMTDEVMGGGWSTALSLGQREGCLLDRLWELRLTLRCPRIAEAVTMPSAPPNMPG